MKKVLALLIVFIIAMFPSCAKFEKQVVEYGDSYEKLTYNGNDYELFESSGSFRPFYELSAWPQLQDVYTIEDEYFADKKDENVCFLYSDGGILSYLTYKRTDIEIPDRITDSQKVDSIAVRVDSEQDYQYFYIDKKTDVKLLVDFLNSEDVVEFDKNSIVIGMPVPKRTINLIAVSNFYGGGFYLGGLYYIVQENNKFYLKNNNDVFELPEDVSRVLADAVSNQS